MPEGCSGFTYLPSFDSLGSHRIIYAHPSGADVIGLSRKPEEHIIIHASDPSRKTEQNKVELLQP